MKREFPPQLAFELPPPDGRAACPVALRHVAPLNHEVPDEQRGRRRCLRGAFHCVGGEREGVGGGQHSRQRVIELHNPAQVLEGRKSRDKLPPVGQVHPMTLPNSVLPSLSMRPMVHGTRQGAALVRLHSPCLALKFWNWSVQTSTTTVPPAGDGPDIHEPRQETGAH